MNSRKLIVLALAALGLTALAFWLGADRAPRRDEPVAGPLLPGFEARINALTALRLTGAGGRPLATLQKSDAGWVVTERGWPADTRQLRSWLLNLAQAKRIEAKTGSPDRYDALGVEDVSRDDAQGVQVTLEGGGEPVTLIVGNASVSGQGSYVRLGGDAQSWLTDTDLTVEREPGQWLARELTAIAPDRIERVEVTPSRGPTYRIAREDERFALTPVPSGRRLAGEFSAESTAGVLDQLRLDDVAKADAQEPGEAPMQSARFVTVDGLGVEVQAWQPESSKTWARFTVAFDEAKARAYLEAERAKAEAAKQGAEKSGDEAALAAVPEPVDVEARLAALRDEVATLQRRFEGHVFLLPAYKAGNLMKARDDFLAPVN